MISVLGHGAGGLEALGLPLSLLLGFVGAVYLGTAAWLGRSGGRPRAPEATPAAAPLAAGGTGLIRPTLAAVAFLVLLVVALFGPSARGGNLAALAVLTLFWFLLTACSALLGPVHQRWSPLAPLLRWLHAPDRTSAEPPAVRGDATAQAVSTPAGASATTAPTRPGVSRTTPAGPAVVDGEGGAGAPGYGHDAGADRHGHHHGVHEVHAGPPPAPVVTPTLPSVAPAAAALAVFLWAASAAGSGPVTAAVLVGWAVLGLAGGLRHGIGWLERGDPFAVWSTTAGWLSPLGRDEGGRPCRRRARRVLAHVEAAPALWVVVALVLGANLFELLRDAVLLEALAPGGSTLEAVVRRTLGFGLAVAVMAAAVRIVTIRRPWLVPVLVPVAVGTTVTLLLGPVLLEVQSVSILASDPFQVGWDLFGTSRRYLSVEPLPPALVAAVQLAVFLGGHVLALIAAHDRATARFDPRAARAVQFPVRALLLLTLLGGITLLLSAVE